MIYTQSLDKADEISAESVRYENYDLAVGCFNTKVKELLDVVFENQLLDASISIYKNKALVKALVKIKDTYHCIALVEEV